MKSEGQYSQTSVLIFSKNHFNHPTQQLLDFSGSVMSASSQFYQLLGYILLQSFSFYKNLRILEKWMRYPRRTFFAGMELWICWWNFQDKFVFVSFRLVYAPDFQAFYYIYLLH